MTLRKLNLYDKSDVPIYANFQATSKGELALVPTLCTFLVNTIFSEPIAFLACSYTGFLNKITFPSIRGT